MAKQLAVADFASHLRSPVERAPLKLAHDALVCTITGKRFPIRDEIVDFVDASILDDVAQGELAGNDFVATGKEMEEYAHKYDAYPAARHVTEKDIDLVVDCLRKIGSDELCCLGAGGGMEAMMVAQRYPLKRVFCSDISLNKHRVVLVSLRDLDIQVGLFASDFDHCPWAGTDVPLLIHQALHHTGAGMHRTLHTLLGYGFKNVILVEPTKHFLTGWLARIGFAQRVEYSGVKPGRLDIAEVASYAKEFGYVMRITTNWSFPPDYFRNLGGNNRFIGGALLRLSDVMSWFTNFVHCGNNSVCWLSKFPPESKAAV